MARFTEASKQAVIDRMDAVAVVEGYIRLEKKSGRYWGLCPFHHEKTPSFTVDPDRKLYYCFGCHKGGTIIDFIMEMDKLKFNEAVETLAKRFGVELSYEGGQTFEDSGKKDRIDALAELYRRVSVSFHHLLTEKSDGKRALQYIMERGFTIGTIDRFRLGYAPSDRSWLFRFLTKKGGFSEDFLASSGLFSPKYPRAAFFSGRVMFPIADKGGRTVAFGGRILEGEGPKYINSSESELFKKGMNLFALDLAIPEIRRTKTVYLAEGYMDVLALHQAGITNAVAPLGTAFTDDQAKLLKRWADRVCLMLDSDTAGQTAAVKAVLCCRKNGLDCAVVPLSGEKNKDPADILQKNGPEALQKAAECCINDFTYLVSRSRAFTDKSKAVAFLFPYISVLDSEVARDDCIRIMADEFGVDHQAVLDDYRREERGGFKAAVQEKPEKTLRTNSELLLLAAVFTHPELFKELRTKLSVEDLDDPHAKELYIILEERFRNDMEGLSGDPAFLNGIEEGELRDFIIRQNASGAFSKSGKILEDGIARVKARVLERRRKEIIRFLHTPDSTGMRQEDLLAEKIHIDAELMRLKETNE
ncbi:MAG: DNA primase [Treponema sp.]|jgi:DNA primase|nr:DNA primase [Treponema sp.]